MGKERPRGRDARRQSHSVSAEHTGYFARLRSLFKPSILLAAWEALVAASIIPSVLLILFQIPFDAGIVWQWVFIYLADAIFIASMVARFLTGFMKRGVLVTDRKLVVLYYLKRSFSVDLLSVIPFELFAFAATGSREETLALAAILRLNRCIRCYRVWTFIGKYFAYKINLFQCEISSVAKENELGTNTSLLMTIKSSFLAGLSIHVVSCLWFMISCQNQATFNSRDGTNSLCDSNSWAKYPSECTLYVLQLSSVMQFCCLCRY